MKPFNIAVLPTAAGVNLKYLYLVLTKLWIQLLSAPFSVGEQTKVNRYISLLIHPPHEEELMKEYTQLTLPQRYEISALHKVGQGPTQLARIVGVHRTTISRELKRN